MIKMTKIDDMQKEILTAMKEKDTLKLNVLKMVKGAIQLEKINNGRELNDELFIDVVVKQIKERNESIEEFKRGNRQDLVDKTQAEIDILNTYLPEQLSEEEVDKTIEEIFALVKPTSQKDMGAIMKEATAKLKGKADMKMVSTKIKDKLANL
jgi:uncharacterized protein YqeY